MENEQASAHGLPAWLDGRTIALVGAVFTVGIGLGTMNLASESAIRAHIDTRIGDVNTRITGVETSLNRRITDTNTRITDTNARITDLGTSLNARIDGLDSRLRGVEVGIAQIRGHLGLHGPVRAGDETPPADAAQGTAARGSSPAAPDAHRSGADLTDR